MASVHEQPTGMRASAPRIVLPVTSRGLVVTDRLCWWVLGAAMAAAAGLILFLNRGTTFYADELAWVFLSPGLGPSDVLEPHNGHLIATTRLLYKGILETIGTDYAVFRVIAVGTLVLSAGLFYALVKRRMAALPALAPALVLLFLGSAWSHVVIPIGFPILLSVASGLAALLCLERADLRGDVAACALLVLSVASYTSGLAFVAGVAAAVLIAPNRRSRAWVFLVPLALYAAWFVWSLSSAASPESEGRISNALLIPSYAVDSLSSVMGAITGLGYSFGRPLTVAPGWGQLIAVAAVVALAIRVRRGPVPVMVWVGVALVLAYWTLGALVTEADTKQLPGEVRYIYVGAVGVLLAATAAAAPLRFSRLGLGALFAVTAISLATNLTVLREGAGAFRTSYAPTARAQFTALDLARGHVDPGFNPQAAVPDFSPVGSRADLYFAVADRYGTLGFSPDELARQGEGVREGADRVLAAALGLRLEPTSRPPAGRCRTLRAASGQPIAFALPGGGATLRVESPAAGTLTVGRFGELPAVELGALQPGRASKLSIPRDASPLPWRASISGARSVAVCPPA
jgi:hypothetical protein